MVKHLDSTLSDAELIEFNNYLKNKVDKLGNNS